MKMQSVMAKSHLIHLFLMVLFNVSSSNLPWPLELPLLHLWHGNRHCFLFTSYNIVKTNSIADVKFLFKTLGREFYTSISHHSSTWYWSQILNGPLFTKCAFFKANYFFKKSLQDEMRKNAHELGKMFQTCVYSGTWVR